MIYPAFEQCVHNYFDEISNHTLSGSGGYFLVIIMFSLFFKEGVGGENKREANNGVYVCVFTYALSLI